MKLLIVSSADPIFLGMAEHLSELVREKHEVTIVTENAPTSIAKIFRQRIKKAGVKSGLSQFVFKVYDVALLRKKFRKLALKSNSGVCYQSINSINSNQSRELISKFDVVICIATSIVKQETLDASKYGFVNVHPGVLPLYRGIGNFWAVVNKDWINIGCTCHWMTREIDVGRVITITKIEPNFENLWEMNCISMMAGIDDLSKVINEGALLDINAGIDESKSNYYSWYGVIDYFKFKNALCGLNKTKK